MLKTFLLVFYGPRVDDEAVAKILDDREEVRDYHWPTYFNGIVIVSEASTGHVASLFQDRAGIDELLVTEIRYDETLYGYMAKGTWEFIQKWSTHIHREPPIPPL